MLRTTVGTLVLAATMALMGHGAAIASRPGDAATTGWVTLFANPDFTGTATILTYAGCSPPYVATARQVGSYDNRPAAGCQLAIRNAIGEEHPLCAGRAVVPIEFRQNARLIARPGESVPCPRWPASTFATGQEDLAERGAPNRSEDENGSHAASTPDK